MPSAVRAPQVPDLGTLLTPSLRATPVGASLDLIRLPIVQPHRALDRGVGADVLVGSIGDAELSTLPPLPREMYERTSRTVDRFGVERVVTISGHPHLGLPYGGDVDVLLALIKLADEDRQRVLAGGRPRVVNGEYIAVTAWEIASAMGLVKGNAALTRIRAALRRFAHVRITTMTTEIRQTSELARALEAGDPEAVALIPTRSRPSKRMVREEQVTWLLEYRVREEIAATGATERWIGMLRLNPLFIDQALTGWAAWIDMDVFRALSGPYAKRLYQLCAVEAAYGTPTPWVFSLEHLRAACPLPANDAPSHLLARNLTPALMSLVEHGVLASASHRRLKERGAYEFTLVPGPVLLLAQWLRGAAGVDLREVRTQFAFLRAFGFDAKVARAMMDADPAGVHEALRYACFLRETGPERVTVSWSAMIKERVEQKRSNAGTPGYEEWLDRRLQSLTSGASATTDTAFAHAAYTPPQEDTAPASTPLVFTDDPWGRTLTALLPVLSETTLRTWLVPLALVSLADDVATLSAPDDFAAEWVMDRHAEKIVAQLSTELGVPVQLRVRSAARLRAEAEAAAAAASDAAT